MTDINRHNQLSWDQQSGAVVTSFDQSPEQLRKDTDVAARDNLSIQCLQGIWQICLYSMTQASM